MSILKKCEGVFEWIIDALAFFTGIIVIVLMLLICIEVVTRYFLNAPIGGIMDIVKVGILWIAFLSAAWLRIDGHVNMDFVITLLKPKQACKLTIATSILGAMACFTLSCFGIWATWDNWVSGIKEMGMIEIPTFLVIFVIPLGLILITIQFIIRAYRSSRKLSDII
jgi:TRAP-type C4-dicarboxylate transport system permease small subunit